MNKLILDIKSEIKYKLLFLSIAIAAFIGGIIVFSFAVNVSAYDTSGMKIIGLILSASIMAFGLYAIIYSFVQCNGYVKIYDNHSEGKGIQGKGMKSFYLSNNQIKSVTSESYFLCFHTYIGEFKIICSKEYHEKALSFFNTQIGSM